MSLLDYFRRKPAPAVKEKRRPMTLAEMQRIMPAAPPPRMFESSQPFKGVLPQGQKLAMDDAVSPAYGYLNQGTGYEGSWGAMSLGIGYGNEFPGYPRLIAMSQRPEYRMISEVLAKQMTRAGIILSADDDSRGDDGKGGGIEARKQVIKELQDDLLKFNVSSIFRNAAEHDGLYGRAQVYIDVKMPGGGQASKSPTELATPLSLTPEKVQKGSLLGFRLVEPMWCYPAEFDALDPLSSTYYRPESWYVMAKKVHSSRLLFFCARPVADILKPVYQFGGLSMTQLAAPAVENWLRTRDSIGDLVHAFSLTIIKSDLSSLLQSGTDEQMAEATDTLGNRMVIFNEYRDNRGSMLIDKEMEEIDQINTPVSGLHELQAQAQEHIASVSHIPLLFLLGTSPSGLNASTDGEVRAFYDWILAMQEDVLRGPYQAVLDLLQLNRYGKIDPAIKFTFAPLWQMDDADAANVRKANADADAVLIDRGVISPEESRQRVASDPTGGYQSIDPNDVPEPPAMPGLMDPDEEDNGNGSKATGDDS